MAGVLPRLGQPTSRASAEELAEMQLGLECRIAAVKAQIIAGVDLGESPAPAPAWKRSEGHAPVSQAAHAPRQSPAAHAPRQASSYSPPAAPHEELAAKVKEFQRSGWEAKEAWHSYCDGKGGGVRDPLKHDAAFLRAFLDTTGRSGKGGKGESAGNREVIVLPTPPGRKRKFAPGHHPQVLCRYWSSTGCRNGGACTFAHGEHELRPPKAQKKREPEGKGKGKGSKGSKNSKGSGKGGKGHLAPGEERQFLPGCEPGTLCMYWPKGECRNGNSCPFAHGEEELRLVAGDEGLDTEAPPWDGHEEQNGEDHSQGSEAEELEEAEELDDEDAERGASPSAEEAPASDDAADAEREFEEHLKEADVADE